MPCLQCKLLGSSAGGNKVLPMIWPCPWGNTVSSLELHRTGLIHREPWRKTCVQTAGARAAHGRREIPRGEPSVRTCVEAVILNLAFTTRSFRNPAGRGGRQPKTWEQAVGCSPQGLRRRCAWRGSMGVLRSGVEVGLSQVQANPKSQTENLGLDDIVDGPSF